MKTYNRYCPHCGKEIVYETKNNKERVKEHTRRKKQQGLCTYSGCKKKRVKPYIMCDEHRLFCNNRRRLNRIAKKEKEKKKKTKKKILSNEELLEELKKSIGEDLVDDYDITE